VKRVRQTLALIWPLLALPALVILLSTRFGVIPAIGPLLEPHQGLWVPPDDDLSRMKSANVLSGLRSEVRVRFDADRIAHIRAENDEDLYFMQGYIQASHRLWQMEFIARAASGRLSEVLGPRTLEFDKMFTKIGLNRAAEETVARMLEDQQTREALLSYAAGVNAYVASLEQKHLPFEYKLLQHRPEPWTPVKSALLLKFMAFHLSFHSHDLTLSRTASLIPRDDFLKLFPLQLPTTEPIVPTDAKWNFQSLAGPQPQQVFQPSLGAIQLYQDPHPNNGSNNWAVMGKKSTTGFPIVANDIHLSYSIPSLWYAVRLESPTQNVMGATLPGSPGVVVGFNSQVSWAVTNGGDDVIDWFEMKFRDEGRTEYVFDGVLKPVTTHEHTIMVRGRDPVRLSLRQTHFGPIVYELDEKPTLPSIPRGLAMRWVALEASNELKTFLELNRAKNFSECQAAVSHFGNPSQNFICADVAGDVGMFHQAKIPIRWPGQGRLISDGSDSAYDWKGYVPESELPRQINPSRGFVSSANQRPVDEQYPHYLGWPYEVPYRGERINEVLRSKEKFSPQDMLQMQMDSDLLPARKVLPILLSQIELEKLNELERPAFELLKKWDYRSLGQQSATTIFHVWWMKLNESIWGAHFSTGSAEDSKFYFWPRMHQTIELILHQPDSLWLTTTKEGNKRELRQLAMSSFREAINELNKKFGRNLSNWHWNRYRRVEFPHFARVPGLGVEVENSDGHTHSILSNQGNHGPVWKMVVALKPDGQTEAWGIYPGGQSGEPNSRFYDAFLEPWARGDVRPLRLGPAKKTPAEHEIEIVFSGVSP